MTKVKNKLNKKGKVKSLRTPSQEPFTVVHSEKAWIQTQSLINHYGSQGNEVSWFTPIRVNDDSRILYIPEIFVPEQEVHGTEADAADLDAIVADVIEAGYGLDSIRGWFHLHPRTMSTNPSGQDNKQVEEYLNSGFSTLLRGILNNSGDINLDYYDDENNVHYYDLDNVVLTNPETQKIAEDILSVAKERVKKRTYVANKSTYTPNNYASNNTYASGGSNQCSTQNGVYRGTHFGVYRGTHFGVYTYAKIGATEFLIRPSDVEESKHASMVDIYEQTRSGRRVSDETLANLMFSGVITPDQIVNAIVPYFGIAFSENFVDEIEEMMPVDCDDSEVVSVYSEDSETIVDGDSDDQIEIEGLVDSVTH